MIHRAPAEALPQQRRRGVGAGSESHRRPKWRQTIGGGRSKGWSGGLGHICTNQRLCRYIRVLTTRVSHLYMMTPLERFNSSMRSEETTGKTRPRKWQEEKTRQGGQTKRHEAGSDPRRPLDN